MDEQDNRENIGELLERLEAENGGVPLPGEVPTQADPDLPRIRNSFTYHAPFGDQPERYLELRDRARDLAVLILATCPPSRERSVAITKLEEAIMWANKSIACNEKPGV